MGKQEAWEKAQSKVDLELREVRGRKEGLEGEMRGELRNLALRCEDLVGRLREGESERESLLSETRRLRADKEQLYRKVVDAQNDLEKQKAIALENHLAASLGDSQRSKIHELQKETQEHALALEELRGELLRAKAIAEDSKRQADLSSSALE